MSSRSTGQFARHMSGFTLATLLSRVLGYARDAAIVHHFGGGTLTDSFYAAFRIANFFRRTLGEGALNASFVPVLTQERLKGTANARDFLDSLWTTLALVSGAVVVLGIWQARPLVLALTYGFASDPEKLQLTVDLTRILFPHLFFVTTAALAQGTLNVTRRFFVPALAPTAFSLAILAYLGMLWAGWLPLVTLKSQVYGLAVAATLGGALQWLIQLPLLEKEGLGLRLRSPAGHPAVWQVAALMGPSLLSLATDQIDTLVDTVFASFLPPGSITAVYNSSRLMQLPLALFGVASATVALAHLSEHAAAGRKEAFKRTLGDSLGITAFVLMPSTAGLMAISLPLVRTLFEHGNFTPEQSRVTAVALFYYAIGLVAYGWAKVLVMASYAVKDAVTPVRLSMLKVALNVALCAVLVGPLGVGGLALAASASSWLCTLLLYRGLARRLREEGAPGGARRAERSEPEDVRPRSEAKRDGALTWPELARTAWKPLLASVVLYAGCLGTSAGLHTLLPGARPWLETLVTMAMAVPAYYGLAVLLDIPERHLVWKVLGRAEPGED